MGGRGDRGLPFGAMRRLLVVVSCVAAVLAFAPAALATPDDGLPDIWSGSWEAELMPEETPLGTLTWRPISYAEGVAYVGKHFGGRAFEGCPADGRSRFFRGRYQVGGDLIACTSGEAANTLVGRFDGNDILRSGSFTVTMVEFGDEAEFLGQYFEDDGITVDWCGDFLAGTTPLPVADTPHRWSTSAAPPASAASPPSASAPTTRAPPSGSRSRSAVPAASSPARP